MQKCRGLYEDHRWPQVKNKARNVVLYWKKISKNDRSTGRESPLHSELLYFLGWFIKIKISKVTCISVLEKMQKYYLLWLQKIIPQVLGSIILFLPYEKWWMELIMLHMKKKASPRHVMWPTSIIRKSRCVFQWVPESQCGT